MNLDRALERRRNRSTPLEAARTCPRFHGRQIFHWIHARGVTDLARDDRPPSRRCERGSPRRFTLETPLVEAQPISATARRSSCCGSRTAAHRSRSTFPTRRRRRSASRRRSAARWRCALLPDRQDGTRTRHLTAGEIAGQVRAARARDRPRELAFNIVLMGMGEPLHNYDATMKALRIMADEDGPRRPAAANHALDGRPRPGARAACATSRSCRISRSPCTRRPTSSGPRSSRSTGATTSKRCIAACRRFPLGKRRRMTFEYVLLAGVNDTPDDARRLVELLDGIRAKVNLLPLNEAPGIPFRARPDETASTRSRASSPIAA